MIVEQRTLIGKFIHSSWINMNIRAGKYRHLQTKYKNKCYENIKIEFSREQYKNWCLKNKNLILSLNRPSLDRKNNNLNYTLKNIQVIELINNIVKNKLIFDLKNGTGICSKCKEKKLIEEFTTDKRRQITGKVTICKKCDNKRNKQRRSKIQTNAFN